MFGLHGDWKIKREVKFDMNRLDALMLQAMNDLPTPDEDAEMAQWIRDVLTLMDMEDVA